MDDTYVLELEKAVGTLESTHEKVKARIIRESYPDVDPYTVVSTDGRYILLDSLTAIVNARTTLVSRCGSA